ncbi:MAG: Smr/MutS family protein [Longimonas sp.]|uniref:Smr/MutS family protein n=1 Tax=Longimonas sp. TaxID=2039626 RepID=UPI003363153A
MVRLDDDGTTVTLDLHGLTVDEALSVTKQTLNLAEDRGRATLRIIHGHSTSGGIAPRTIKTALHDALDTGFLHPYREACHRQQGVLLISLGITAGAQDQPIRATDVWPP